MCNYTVITSFYSILFYSIRLTTNDAQFANLRNFMFDELKAAAPETHNEGSLRRFSLSEGKKWDIKVNKIWHVLLPAGEAVTISETCGRLPCDLQQTSISRLLSSAWKHPDISGWIVLASQIIHFLSWSQVTYQWVCFHSRFSLVSQWRTKQTGSDLPGLKEAEMLVHC